LQVAEIVSDLESFVDKLRTVNTAAKMILTVSPVPLVATYEDRHVLVSTIASKSILRAAAELVCRTRSDVAYFPSYEIVIGPQTAGRYFKPDLREVTEEGVTYVMEVFNKHYLTAAPRPMQFSPQTGNGTEEPTLPASAIKSPTALSVEDLARMSAVSKVICDEDEIVSE
jgi:hypothetical protein